ncbi:MAG TPA: hypothetical protein VGO88_04480 [Mycetocola sp.]|jgi:hypothetical protein|nr:hypothetical protein [Mycetocola sp.]
MSGDNLNEWNDYEVPPGPPLPAPATDSGSPVREIGMPPGMEPALDTMPSSHHGIPVPVARPEFGVAPTPFSPQPGNAAGTYRVQVVAG